MFLSEKSSKNIHIFEMKEPAGEWKTQMSENNFTVILFTVCHPVVSCVVSFMGPLLAWMLLVD